jgi:hypothetical protein
MQISADLQGVNGCYFSAFWIFQKGAYFSEILMSNADLMNFW